LDVEDRGSGARLLAGEAAQVRHWCSLRWPVRRRPWRYITRRLAPDSVLPVTGTCLSNGRGCAGGAPRTQGRTPDSPPPARLVLAGDGEFSKQRGALAGPPPQPGCPKPPPPGGEAAPRLPPAV